MGSPYMPAGGYVSDYLAFWAIWLLVVGATVLFLRRTRGRRGAVRLVAGNLLVLACIAWTAAVAAETYLRWFYDTTDQYGLMLTNRAWFMRHIHENNAGVRDVDFVPEKRPGTVRVACVGDSFTMGWGVDDPANAFPQRIGAVLAARAPGHFEVRNYGIPGLTTREEIQPIEDLARAGGTDHVILGYCLNDPDDLLPPDRWFDREAAPGIPWMKQTRSFLADYLWFHLRLAKDPRVRDFFSYEKEAYDDPKIWAVQCDQFRRIAATCRAASIRLDVIVFPFFQVWGEDYPFATCHDRVVAAWKALGVDAIDLRDCYRGIPGADLVVNRFDAHPNERAHEIAARTILARVFGVR